MRDYLEELLEEWAEEENQGSVWEKTPSPPPAGGTSPGGGGEGKRTGGEIPQSVSLTAPLVRGPRGTGHVQEDAFYEESDGENHPVSFADSPLSKGAKRGAVEALRSRLRRGTLVAELDAAVRRDARRYDGGFELY